MIKKVLEYFHIKCEINNREVSLAGFVNILGKKRNIMQAYTVSQWFLFFFIYCFIGWVWESCYVSAKSGKWVNRGFLHGPALPIYGSGAIVILVSTIGVRESIPLIFLFGMISSTILEFVTGYCMERMFGVRYWDYSKKPFNLMGHICLFSSIGWGIFSVLLVRIVHRPIESVVCMIPVTIADIIAFGVAIIMTVDFTQSFNEAMDLKATIERIASSNQQIKTIAKRIEVATAFAEDDYNKMKEKLAEGKATVMNNVSKAKGRLTFERNMDERKGVKLATLQKMSETIVESLRNKLMDEKYANQLLETLENEKVNLRTDNKKSYKSVFRMVKRNPGAVSRSHSAELDEIKKLIK